MLINGLVTELDEGDHVFQSHSTALKDVESQLRKVIDPEMGINIIDMGMVKSASIDEDGRVSVSLLLTTPACPLWELFEYQVKSALGEGTLVNFVTEPRWTPAMMEEDAREELIRRGMISSGRVALDIGRRQ